MEEEEEGGGEGGGEGEEGHRKELSFSVLVLVALPYGRPQQDSLPRSSNVRHLRTPSRQCPLHSMQHHRRRRRRDPLA